MCLLKGLLFFLVVYLLVLLVSGCVPSGGDSGKISQSMSGAVGNTGSGMLGFLVFAGAVAISFGIAASVNGSLWSKVIGGGIAAVSIGLLILAIDNVLSKYSGWIFLLLVISAVVAFVIWLYHHFERSQRIKYGELIDP